ncbi:hypothetical protein HanIR_Chr14g0694421 [Helianthus annuus]|nr:hypothetical protein HanIR_Chr14g0694421 [Helianthus annuus]
MLLHRNKCTGIFFFLFYMYTGSITLYEPYIIVYEQYNVIRPNIYGQEILVEPDVYGQYNIIRPV